MQFLLVTFNKKRLIEERSQNIRTSGTQRVGFVVVNLGGSEQLPLVYLFTAVELFACFGKARAWNAEGWGTTAAQTSLCSRLSFSDVKFENLVALADSHSIPPSIQVQDFIKQFLTSQTVGHRVVVLILTFPILTFAALLTIRAELLN